MKGQRSYGPMKVWSTLGCLFVLLSLVNAANFEKAENRTFEINYEENSFWMDGKPFRYVSGSLHYFRSPHETWRDRLRTLRSAGLNAVSTYIEWSFHEPEKGVYRWTGDNDLVNFIKIAQEEDLYVILRPGPYICAERDLGGYPYWLLTLYPNIQLRTNDFEYKKEVTIWYAELMSRMQPLLYGNGGPIITVQVENEYGYYYACDHAYMEWLAELTYYWVHDAAVLFTTDGASQGALTCGSTPGVYATVDFGTDRNASEAWETMREFSPKGPLVNSEFYPGWITYWGQEEAARVPDDVVTRALELMIQDNHTNVNFYVFHGGTNFEYSAGANSDPYIPDVTSYDYNAPMTEAGDPTTKYFAIRDVVMKYTDIEPPHPPPEVKAKWSLPEPLTVVPAISLMSEEGRQQFGRPRVVWERPPTMEAIGQRSGFTLYETLLTPEHGDVALLTVEELRDRAMVYLDSEFIGILSRMESIYSLPILINQGHLLQILVENQGRQNSGVNDFKGIIGNVTLGTTEVLSWNVTSFPLESVDGLTPVNDTDNIISGGTLYGGPVFFTAKFQVSEGDVLDTYLDVTGWNKGLAWVNGRHLGRYWPVEGPQVTLYTPGAYLKPYPEDNTIVLLELQRAPLNLNQTISFIDYTIGI